MPVEMATEQGTASVFPYSIEAKQSMSLSTHNEGVDITAAYADVVPAAESVTPLAYAILNFAENGFLAVTIEGVEAASEFKMYAEFTGDYPAALGTMPALAMANSSDTPATVTLKLTGFDGKERQTAVVTLPPRGHLSRFIYEIPGFENLPPTPYLGIL